MQRGVLCADVTWHMACASRNQNAFIVNCSQQVHLSLPYIHLGRGVFSPFEEGSGLKICHLGIRIFVLFCASWNFLQEKETLLVTWCVIE